ncbi:hypothetical protein [Caldimonas brevitalea]|uniref:Uncharacterized protein n=1 Tax=Caldimonas brevitalea TaxID=413882 RepID=A0A0G3BK50_9BURK|nr:hypothetical protein [Caldimonas brevitalea]AKJ28358.1 hypothetical protein AAW51_1667 [Caldimonas brevitalea]
MNTVLATAARPTMPRLSALDLWRELRTRQRTLTLFATALLALMVPLAIAAGLDDRLLRGANVWWKPLKFSLSIAVFAITTAWFIGHLPAERRSSRSVRCVVGLTLVAGGFELGYITLQAALGQASHYNNSDTLHAVMYTLMGVGAVLLTATQPLLAWQLHRHSRAALAPAYRLGVTAGLLLTFVLGTGVGALLSTQQPPSGGIPIVGWSLSGGDLRPAHFLGIHAQQLLPLAGLALARLPVKTGCRAVALTAVLYAAACVSLTARAWGG